jgi:hypothetical protein
MADPNEVQGEQEQLRRRAVTLMALRFVHIQLASLTEHIAALQQQIRSLEQGNELPQGRERRAA